MNQNQIGTVSVIGNTPDPNLRLVARTLTAHAEKVNTVVQMLFPYQETKRGLVSANPDTRYTMSIDLENEDGINAALGGIDGTTIYTFSSSELEDDLPKYIQLHPIFYVQDENDPSLHRPRTIYESFLGLIEYIDDQIASVSDNTSPGQDSCITDCSYTKSYIGATAFDSGQESSPTSMDGRISLLECRIQQIAKDAFGEEYVWSETCGEPQLETPLIDSVGSGETDEFRLGLVRKVVKLGETATIPEDFQYVYHTASGPFTINGTLVVNGDYIEV